MASPESGNLLSCVSYVWSQRSNEFGTIWLFDHYELQLQWFTWNRHKPLNSYHIVSVPAMSQKKQQLKKPRTEKRAYIQYGLSRKTASTVFIPVLIRVFHCEAIIVYYITKTPMQNTEIVFFSKAKIENTGKCLIFLNISTQNILRGYMFEPPRRGGCNECPQCTFWIKNNKNRYTPANPSFSI